MGGMDPGLGVEEVEGGTTKRWAGGLNGGKVGIRLPLLRLGSTKFARLRQAKTSVTTLGRYGKGRSNTGA